MITTLALGLFLVWLAVAFVARSVIQALRTGDAGWRMPGGDPRSLQWWTRLMMGIGAFGGGIGGPVADLAGFARLNLLDRDGLRIAGLVLACVATVATVTAQQAMGASWRIGVDEHERTTLVTGGPFAVVRNPIFSAVMVFAVGMVLAVPNLVALLGFAVAVTGIQLQVRLIEEPYLLLVHGAPYRAYASRVGRFVPGLGRLPAGGSGPLDR